MERFKPTAKPLVTVDPYFSIWSFSDHLNKDVTRHWSGRRNSMTLNICTDGKWYSVMGNVLTDNTMYISETPKLPQTGCRIEATKTEYIFENELLKMTLAFRTPLLSDDLELMSIPLSYISYEITYKDNKCHNTEIYFDICSELCADDICDEITFAKTDYSIYCGKTNQEILKKSGDMILIDWGYLHLIAPNAEYGVYTDLDKFEMFKRGHERDSIKENKKICEKFPALTALKKYEGNKISDFLAVAYNDIYSIEYFGEKLEPYWKKNGITFEEIVKKSLNEYESINLRCDKFDKELRTKASELNEDYANILCLSYRQTVAAHKLVHHKGKPLLFSKECGSNGCIATVDVTYPSIPMLLLYNTDLVKGMLNPVFEYTEGEHGWKYDFAPHDLGIYPKANRQWYISDRAESEDEMSSQMPVEECGNMLLSTAAVCKEENSGEYAKEHYAILKKWADYLVSVGYDPDKQLCTDDFAGYLAHNCNLSVKLIEGIAAFGYISDLLGKDGKAYYEKAKEYAKKWEESANDGEFYRLAFDKEGTWSLKYNLVMDKYFGFDLFSKEVFEKEIELYKKKMNRYGVPLDCREDYTKSDWQMWTACLTDDKEYFDLITKRMTDLISDIDFRVPFTDWYKTSDAVFMAFQARSVQGGLFMPLLIKNKN